MLARGTVVEMVLDRPLEYSEGDLAPGPAARGPRTGGVAQ
jgi:hypothetical protein